MGQDYFWLFRINILFSIFYTIPPALNEEQTMHSEKESDITVHNIKPSSPIENQIIYIDKEPDITIHNITLIEVSAKSIHNPPQVNDMITIEFKIQNVSNRPITLNQDIGSFVAARNPSHENEDFGYSNQSKTIQPQDNIKNKASPTLLQAPLQKVYALVVVHGLYLFFARGQLASSM